MNLFGIEFNELLDDEATTAGIFGISEKREEDLLFALNQKTNELLADGSSFCDLVMQLSLFANNAQELSFILLCAGQAEAKITMLRDAESLLQHENN